MLKNKDKIIKWVKENKIFIDPLYDLNFTLRNGFFKRQKDSKYFINENYEIEVFSGHVWISGLHINNVPVKFKCIRGNLYIRNTSLESLYFCPNEVNGSLFVNNNLKLTSLNGCPYRIYGVFNCENNNLNSLENCPIQISKDFICRDNPLKSLNGVCLKGIKGQLKIDPYLENDPIYKMYLLRDNIKNMI